MSILAFCEANVPVVVVSSAGDLPTCLLVALDLNVVDILPWAKATQTEILSNIVTMHHYQCWQNKAKSASLFSRAIPLKHYYSKVKNPRGAQNIMMLRYNNIMMHNINDYDAQYSSKNSCSFSIVLDRLRSGADTDLDEPSLPLAFPQSRCVGQS